MKNIISTVFISIFINSICSASSLIKESEIKPGLPYATIGILHTFDANNTPPVTFENGSKTYVGKHFVEKEQIFSYELSNDYIYLWTYEGVEKFNIHSQRELHVATDTPFTFVMNGSFVKIPPLKNGEKYNIKVHQFSVTSPASAFKFFPSFEKLNKEGPQIKYPDYFKADSIIRGITTFSLNRLDGYWDIFVKIPATSSLGSILPTYHIKKGLIFDSNSKWSPNVGGRINFRWPNETEFVSRPSIQSAIVYNNFWIGEGDKRFLDQRKPGTHGIHLEQLNGEFWISGLLAQSLNEGLVVNDQPYFRLASAADADNKYFPPKKDEVMTVEFGTYYVPPMNQRVFIAGGKSTDLVFYSKFQFNNDLILSEGSKKLSLKYSDASSKCTDTPGKYFPLPEISGDSKSIFIVPAEPQFRLRFFAHNLGNIGPNKVSLIRQEQCEESYESDKAASPEIQFEKVLTSNEELVLPVRTDGSSYVVDVNGTKVNLNLAETFSDSESFDLHLGRVSIINEPSHVLFFDVYGLDKYKENRTMLLASKLAPTDSISVLPGNYEVLSSEKIIGAPERKYSHKLTIENEAQ